MDDLAKRLEKCNTFKILWLLKFSEVWTWYFLSFEVTTYTERVPEAYIPTENFTFYTDRIYIFHVALIQWLIFIFFPVYIIDVEKPRGFSCLNQMQ